MSCSNFIHSALPKFDWEFWEITSAYISIINLKWASLQEIHNVREDIFYGSSSNNFVCTGLSVDFSRYYVLFCLRLFLNAGFRHGRFL